MLVLFVPLLDAVGLFLLSGAGGRGLGIGRGEVLSLFCAIGFATHILILDRVAARFDALVLNAVQLGAVAITCFVPGLFMGGYHFPLRAWLACAYLGVVASAVAFFLQTWAQAHTPPARAALLLMVEPIFAAVLGSAVGRALGVRGLEGAALILVGIVVAGAGRISKRRAPDLAR